MGAEFLGNILYGLAGVLEWVLQVYIWIVIARVLITWVNPDPFNPIVKFLNQVTDPLLFWVRRKIPLNFGGLDFTPILVILMLSFLKFVIVQQLFSLSARLLAMGRQGM